MATKYCSICKKGFEESYLLEIDGARVCSTCKPIVVSRLKTGEELIQESKVAAPVLIEEDPKTKALRMCLVPALIIMVLSTLDLLYFLFNDLVLFLQVSGVMRSNANVITGKSPDEAEQFLGILFSIFRTLIPIPILYGSYMMIKGRKYKMALTAMTLSVIPCLSACCLVGIPFGIWGMIVLLKPQVKEAFGYTGN